MAGSASTQQYTIAAGSSHASLTVWLCICCCCAGIMGYAWVAVLHYWLQLSYRTTLLIATIMPGIWLAVFHSLMRLSQPHSSKGLGQYSAVSTTAEGESEKPRSFAQHGVVWALWGMGEVPVQVQPLTLLYLCNCWNTCAVCCC